MIGLKGVHILRGIQAADKTAFDHVTAKMAADNNVAVDIDLSVLIAARGVARQRAIHRYRDVLIFERRFEFPVTLSSHARSYLDLRAVREITGLCSLIGMDISGVEKALDAVGRVTTPPAPCGPGDLMSPRPPTLRENRRYILVRVEPAGRSSTRRNSITRFRMRLPPSGGMPSPA